MMQADQMGVEEELGRMSGIFHLSRRAGSDSSSANFILVHWVFVAGVHFIIISYLDRAYLIYACVAAWSSCYAHLNCWGSCNCGVLFKRRLCCAGCSLVVVEPSGATPKLTWSSSSDCCADGPCYFIRVWVCSFIRVLEPWAFYC